MISIENLSYKYNDGRPVLNEINIRIKKGEKVCLLGLNGSGKSTLLKLCTGLLTPPTGKIETDGDTIPLHEIGFIFQNPDDQIVGQTVLDDLAFALQNLQLEREAIVARVEAIAREFHLTEMLDRAPDQLSAGEKQRLALAGALITEPSLLLIDEPTSYLDIESTSQLLDFIKSTNATVIAATQFPHEAAHFDRVLFLQSGRVIFDGPFGQFMKSELQPRTITVKVVHPPSDKNVVLGTRDLSFRYGDNKVLSCFTRSFKSGEITAIMGSSGSGKTILAMLLAGLLNPEAGSIERADDTSIGLLLQFPEHNFFADSVYDEVAFAVRNQGMGEEQVMARVRESLALVGLGYEEFTARSPFTLSAGEQRRVAIAAVLVMDCGVYIFDEITCGLDWEGRQLIAELLVDLATRDKCVIICGHDSELAEAVGAETVGL